MKFVIENIVENGDGTCSVEYDYDEEYAEFARQQFILENNGKEPTTEDIERFFAEAVQKIVDQQQKAEAGEELQQDLKVVE